MRRLNWTWDTFTEVLEQYRARPEVMDAAERAWKALEESGYTARFPGPKSYVRMFGVAAQSSVFEPDWLVKQSNLDASYAMKRLVDLMQAQEPPDDSEMSRDLGIHPDTGQPVSVRIGRSGPFVQVGTMDDVEKLKFAGLRSGQKMDTITLADALVLLQLPRKLGETADGEPITVAISESGPYVKYGSTYIWLKKPDDPYTLTLERALEVIEAKKTADANRIIRDFGVDDIKVLNGRYGPYITDKQRNARIPKDRDPKTLTLEECRALLAAAPRRPARSRFGRRGAAAKSAKAAAAALDATAPAGPAAKAKARSKARASAKVKAKAGPAKASPAAEARPKGLTKLKIKSRKPSRDHAGAAVPRSKRR